MGNPTMTAGCIVIHQAPGNTHINRPIRQNLMAESSYQFIQTHAPEDLLH
jgi:hypothetical protein